MWIMDTFYTQLDTKISALSFFVPTVSADISVDKVPDNNQEKQQTY